MRILGNVPSFFSLNNANNFNRGKMAKHLALAGILDRVDSLDGKFDPRRFFSLIRTNSRDSDVAAGWSRRVVGPMSNDLVQIKNAAVADTPRAFVHRSHSGHYGIVTSEEGYQNLQRFLFGDVRVDGVLEEAELMLLTRPLESDPRRMLGSGTKGTRQ